MRIRIRGRPAFIMSGRVFLAVDPVHAPIRACFSMGLNNLIRNRRMRCIVIAFLGLAFATRLAFPAAEPTPNRPNILVILVDDLGYADLACQGSKEVISPNIDSLATHGVRFTAGYVTAPQCCPSRAGLLTGRYQNRFGFEANWPASASGTAGLPPSERTMADHLKAAGYVTGMIGKWHLGAARGMQPHERGFEESFWHPNGGVLFPDPRTGRLRNLQRGPDPVEEAEYSTDAFGREAVEFIGRHQHEPFFLFLSFVPPHWPMEAKAEHLARFAHVPDRHRRTMLAMMASLDDNVGRVLAKLREAGLDEKTLIFFLSDNGGPTGRPRSSPDAEFEYGQNTSKNEPCRGVKGELLEGGIRVPFIVRWKNRIPAGKTYGNPVISLDILPTALAAAGAAPLPGVPLDGTDLLPFLTGENPGIPHETLYWRFRFPPLQPSMHQWAIRQREWKLVKTGRDPVALYDLNTDIGEQKNLAAEHPERVIAMQEAYRRWDALNKEPLWAGVPGRKAVYVSDQRVASEIEVGAYYFPNWGPVAHSEWRSIQAATPKFDGHVQPKIPAWGYENENDPEVMARKIAVASGHGIDAFIFDWYFYDPEPGRAVKSPHYSSDGSRYLHKALENGYLHAPNNDRLKFAILWCNHDAWPDAKGVIKPETFERMTDYVIQNYLKHPSYWRIGGRPYFSIYQMNTFIESYGGDRARAVAALARFRSKARAAGFPELHLNAILYNLGGKDSGATAKEMGLDSVTSYVWIHHFPLPRFPSTDYAVVAAGYFGALANGGQWNGLELPVSSLGLPYHVNVSMGWDSSPRCPPGIDWMSRRDYPFGAVIANNTPERFRDALLMAKRYTLQQPPKERVITLNSWNEWGEGSYLEPDTVHGTRYLEAVREVFGVAHPR